MSSTEAQVFQLAAGNVSAGLARDRLWQVKEGEARLRLLISDDEIGTMPVPESGWFLVPESEYLRIQLIADTAISFESRLPLSLIPRLGDLGRQQLIQPIRQMMSVAGVDDGLIDWSVKLAANPHSGLGSVSHWISRLGSLNNVARYYDATSC